MMRQELLAARSPDTCTYCESEILEGMRAWWDPEDRNWTCTTCVPPGDTDVHSVGYATAASREENRQKIAAASFLR
jgi:hypothetical protein